MTTETPTAATPAPAAEPTAPAAADTLLTAAAPAQGDRAPQPTEPQAAAEAKPAEAAPKPEEKPQGAPEQYADFTVPDGVALDTDTLTSLKDFAKSKNLTQAEAQALVDLGLKDSQKRAAAQAAQLQAVQAEWAQTARADKEFGGDKFDENKALAQRAFDTFGTPALKELLEGSRLGDHPELMRWAYRVGKAISEDKLVPGATRPNGDVLDQMYPTMKR